MKDFFAVQYNFFKDVAKMYLKPFVLFLSFLGVYKEMLRQMLICLFMESKDFSKLQELKYAEEEAYLIASMGDVDEFETTNFKEED